MASVAVPLIASFVVNKVGESQGWDPRMTAVLGAVAGFGAGAFVSAGASVAASQAASTANAARATTTGLSAAGGGAMKGALGAKLSSQAMAGGPAWGYGTAANAAAGARASVGSMNAVANAGAAATQAQHPFLSMQKPTTIPYTPPYQNPYPGLTDASWATPQGGVNPIGGGPQRVSTMGEELGNYIDGWKTRPVDPKTGKETGYSQAENFGVSALKTLMKPLPEEAPVRSGGGGGGGPQAPAYQGGGQSAPYQTVWSFGQPNQGYKPQGI